MTDIEKAMIKRKVKQFTQRGISDASGLSMPTIQNFKDGKSVSLKSTYLICKEIGVRIEFVDIDE
jgi:hypothetical protein